MRHYRIIARHPERDHLLTAYPTQEMARRYLPMYASCGPECAIVIEPSEPGKGESREHEVQHVTNT